MQFHYATVTCTYNTNIDNDYFVALRLGRDKRCHLKFWEGLMSMGLMSYTWRVWQQVQDLSTCWDGRSYGHNRHGSKGEGLLRPFQCSVLFCSLAVLDPRVGHTMDVLSPFISVLFHSDWLFHRESCPRIDVVYPGRAWSSSPACTWHCSLHYFFLQAIPLFSHGVTIVC